MNEVSICAPLQRELETEPFLLLEEATALSGARWHTYLGLGCNHKEVNREDKLCSCQDHSVLSYVSVPVQSVHFKRYNIQTQIKRQWVFSV